MKILSMREYGVEIRLKTLNRHKKKIRYTYVDILTQRGHNTGRS